MRITLLFLFIFTLFLACKNTPKSEEVTDTPANTMTMAPSDALYKQLEGTWQSDEDAKSKIQFAGAKFLRFTNGVKVSEEDLRVHQPCIGVCAEGRNLGNSGCFITVGTEMVGCYLIMKVDVNTLQYFVMDGSAKTLSFTKVKE